MSNTGPKPPAHLDTAARRKWRELLPVLGDHEPATLDALACYAVAFSRWTVAEASITTEGTIIDGRENPHLAIVRRSMVELHRWGKVLAQHRGQRSRQAKKDTAGDGILRLLQDRPA